MNRRKRLTEFSQRLDGEPFIYGENDCSMFPAQWVADITGKELNLPFYDNREAAMDLITKAGGLVNVWSEILEPCGFQQRFDVPDYGDIGVVETRKFGDVGVIFLDFGIACWRTESGKVALFTPRMKTILKMWRIL
jgi:Domain of unknown function (DUF6950)